MEHQPCRSGGGSGLLPCISLRGPKSLGCESSGCLAGFPAELLWTRGDFEEGVSGRWGEDPHNCQAEALARLPLPGPSNTLPAPLHDTWAFQLLFLLSLASQGLQIEDLMDPHFSSPAPYLSLQRSYPACEPNSPSSRLTKGCPGSEPSKLGWAHQKSTTGRALALHDSNLGSVPSTPSGYHTQPGREH